MAQPLRVLIVEDSEDDAALMRRELQRGGYDVTSSRVDTADDMRAALAAQSWDVVLSDHAMPRFSGPAALELLKGSGLDVPFLLVSGKVGEERAAELMRGGAGDYILKDNLARLVPAVERELREAEGRRARKRLEDQYRQAQKMEALGQLAGGVAHDFNNMLTVINGFTDILLSRTQPDDTARAFLEQIKQAGERAASLTRQLLIFSRKQTPVLRVLDLNQVIGDVEKMIRRLIGENIQFTTELGARLRPIKADPGQMEQVLVNLVVNARDAMPRGGQLTVRTRNQLFEESYSRPVPDMPPGSYILLEVQDTGVGMTPEVKAHIFEPFFTTKEMGKGTGLGLATVFGIVKQAGGHIQVQTEPGVGTTFRIYFPEAVEAPADVTTPTSVGRPSPQAKEVVLLAEDEESVRSLVNQVLVRNGYTVLDADNGQKALELARQCPFPIHLLITDLIMPEMGGFELAQQLRQVHPETRVLFMSGYPSPAVPESSLNERVNFLSKPLMPGEVARKVREVLDEGRPARNGK